MKYYAYKVDEMGPKERPWWNINRLVLMSKFGLKNSIPNYSKDIKKAIDDCFFFYLKTLSSIGYNISDYNCIISYKTRKGKYFEFDVICAPIVLDEIFDIENL